MIPRVVLIAFTLALASCRNAPSAQEALEAFRAARPGVDSQAVTVRLWQDGPPWFSCAEVASKLRSNIDRKTVHDAVGHWRPLVLADVISLRDTSAGEVTDPGWCVATVRNATRTAAWKPVRGDSIPSGGLRRGWDVAVGSQRVAMLRKPRVGGDSARVDYLLTVRPNPDGVALGADRDSVIRTALLMRVDGRWVIARIDSAR